jgi:DNA-3-methyladenine glycosylase II
LTASPWADAPVEVRVEVTPPWPFRIGRGSGDGILRRRGATLLRLLHVGEEPVLVAVAQTAPQRVLFAARAERRPAAEAAIERMRFATGVDDDLRPFHDRFAGDPVIGKAVRSRPHVRIHRRAAPWEALAWAITEQLIELERALVIQRRLVARHGRRCPLSGLRDMPAPARIAALAPAELESLDLAARRALALRRAAREVATGRVDLADREQAWPRLAAIPNVGTWTLEMLSLYGQGRYDLVPAGDLGFIKLVGRLSTGNPKARADEAEVRGFFERYGEWKGLAGTYLVLAAASGLLTERPWSPGRAPRPAGTRWSAHSRRPAAA